MTSHELLIDKRIVQRNIEQGKLEPAEYQRILNALPDLSDKVWRRPASADTVASSANVAPASMPPVSNAPESGLVPASAPRSDASDDAAAALLDATPALQPQPTALPG